MSKCLGMLGGMSWESTHFVYRQINQGVAARRGGLHSPELLLRSFDFAAIAAAQAKGQWLELALTLGEAAAGLRRAGAQAIMIATNTMHKVAREVEEHSGLPVLHIADGTGRVAAAKGFSCVGLLGTRFTMEDDGVLMRPFRERYGLNTLVPPRETREDVHRVIFEELCQGRVEPASRELFQRAIDDLAARGAQAVVLGCTEIQMLIGEQDSSLPVLDTAGLHAAMAVEWLCSDEPHNDNRAH